MSASASSMGKALGRSSILAISLAFFCRNVCSLQLSSVFCEDCHGVFIVICIFIIDILILSYSQKSVKNLDIFDLLIMLIFIS